MSDLEILSNSRMKTARGCMREHLFQYDLAFRPVKEDAVLRFGTLAHRGEEAWWNAIKAGAPQDEWLALAILAMAGEADPFERVKAEELVRGYHIRWKDEPFEVLVVEERFETALINPATGAASRTWRLAGKLDVVARDLRTGRIHLIEHKTSSEDIRPGSAYWNRLRMDGQVSVYFDGAAALGFEVVSCLYDVLGKPALKPLKATPVDQRKYTQPTKKEPIPRLYANQRDHDETPEEYRARIIEDIAADPASFYQRCEVVRLESELEEARYDTWQTAQAIQASRIAKRAPRNPDHCHRFGRLCPFFDVCTGAANLEDESRFTKLNDPNPELQEAA